MNCNTKPPVTHDSKSSACLHVGHPATHTPMILVGWDKCGARVDWGSPLTRHILTDDGGGLVLPGREPRMRRPGRDEMSPALKWGFTPSRDCTNSEGNQQTCTFSVQPQNSAPTTRISATTTRKSAATIQNAGPCSRHRGSLLGLTGPSPTCQPAIRRFQPPGAQKSSLLRGPSLPLISLPRIAQTHGRLQWG